MLDIQEKSNGLLFKIFVLPKSSKNSIAGLYNYSIKIKLNVTPIDGSANKMCIKFLSKELNIPKSSIEIVSGFKKTETSKCLFIINMIPILMKKKTTL